MGQAVYLLQPAARNGRSHRWNPFEAVDRRSIGRFRQIARLGKLLFSEINQIGTAGNDNKFWDDAGRQAFKAVASILAESPHQRLCMERITSVFNRADGH